MSTRLVSLWDMLRNYAFLYSALIYDIGNWEKDLHEGTPTTDRQRKFLDGVESDCRELEMEVALEQIDWVRKFIADRVPLTDLAVEVVKLRENIMAHLRRRDFLHVPPSKTKLYVDIQHFGSEVAERLSSATEDIEEAGKCLALGRATACVYHLMRVMELNLKVLAKPLGIPYAPSWESYLKQINDKIAVKHQHKGVQWKRDERLFKELAGDIEMVKVAWRNPTMHIVRHYSPDEAEQIFGAVRILTQRIASRFSEQGKKS